MTGTMTPQPYVKAQKAIDFIRDLPPASVDLVCIDPPYFGIVKETWDNQWKNESEYVAWLAHHLERCAPRLKPHGSILMFGGIGKHGSHPFFDLLKKLEATFHFRNLITWKKRRAYGKSHDYLFCREEIAWLSKSPERTEVTFNIPLTNQLRGYAGFNDRYPAKSEYKRVSNVWDDIPELMRPIRNCEKPAPLMERLVATHSNRGDLVVDFFAGTGATGVAALRLGRRFLGCEAIEGDAGLANARCVAALSNLLPVAEMDENKNKKEISVSDRVPISVSFPFRPTSKMTPWEMQVELDALDFMFSEGASEEGHGGSPGEWMVERMGELETALARRAG